jgi:predicted dehydrogenase
MVVMKEFKWGIAATGMISNQFTQALKYVAGAKLESVASRSKEKAKAYAEKYGFERYYDSYQKMADDKKIDAVYIGTPNRFHLQDCMTFLDAGINVVCEKPLAVNEKQTREIYQKAKEMDVFFLEGLWSRFFPAIKQSLKWIKEGRIGEVSMLTAHFGLNKAGSMDHWKSHSEFCGGSLLDLGIYPLAMAFAVFGTDYSEASGVANVQGGVDICNSFTLKYPDNKIAVMSSARSVILENKVVISGSKGAIIIGEDYNWWHAKKAEIRLNDKGGLYWTKVDEVFVDDYPSTGFQYEAKAVQDCIVAGKKETEEYTWADSIAVAKTMDLLRKQMGVVYDVD